MRFLKRNIEVKPSDPLLTTRWFDLASALLWLSYAFWAIAAVLQQLPIFHLVGAPHWYGLVWAGAIGVTSLAAGIGAVLIFFRVPKLAQITKKRIERDALAVFTTLIFIFHAVLAWTILSGHWIYFASFFVACSYYVMPLFRMYHLNRRIKILAGLWP